MLELLRKRLSEDEHDVLIDVDGADGLKLTLDPELDAVVLDVGYQIAPINT